MKRNSGAMNYIDDLKKAYNEFLKIRWNDLEEVNKVIRQIEEEQQQLEKNGKKQYSDRQKNL